MEIQEIQVSVVLIPGAFRDDEEFSRLSLENWPLLLGRLDE